MRIRVYATIRWRALAALTALVGFGAGLIVGRHAQRPKGVLAATMRSLNGMLIAVRETQPPDEDPPPPSESA